MNQLRIKKGLRVFLPILALLLSVSAKASLSQKTDANTELKRAIKAEEPKDNGGFEIGNGRGGLDQGGFEIGNGRDIIEVVNAKGAHSIKFYEDFDYVIKGENTWATGYLAQGKTKATINLGTVYDDHIPTLAQFLVNGLKEGLWSVVSIAGLQGLKRDTFDEKTKTYKVEIELHLAEGQLLVYQISSSLEGLKEIQAISNSIKMHIN
ncbi:MAG: hypothetical protein H6617_02220 [Bdellovibrionaceae bacterium]|nr:hypothetical protein [Bdellovibrionales bacterium]MCB9253481.1 hypothetical protein [Pseudobdellovibrionaceae bacterium]